MCSYGWVTIFVICYLGIRLLDDLKNTCMLLDTLKKCLQYKLLKIEQSFQHFSKLSKLFYFFILAF